MRQSARSRIEKRPRRWLVPRFSEFYGIVIYMNFGDDEPAHFHARYGEHKASVGIDPIRVIIGHLPNRAQSLVFEWAAMHQQELADNWRREIAQEPVKRIDPLD